MLNAGENAGEAPVVALKGVHMSFGPVHALVDATLTINPGECIGLVGHNGAGKSTFVNVINGRLTPTSGSVHYGVQAEAKRDFKNNQSAEAAGIRSVFQELSLCPNLTVLENLRIPYRKMPVKHWSKRAKQLVLEALDTVFPGHGIDPYAIVSDLTIAERQMVEVAISFAERGGSARMVILDEPTSSLDAAIAQQLLAHIKTYCACGGAAVFITHMMGEIFEVASRVVVMKDGQVTDVRKTDEFTKESLVDAMGHMVSGSGGSRAARSKRELGPEILKMSNGLSARKGEIVGLAGLAGHGQAEALARFYLDKSSDWRSSRNPEVVFVAGDRTRDGVMPLWSILRNLSVKTLVEFSSRGVVDRDFENKLVNEWKEKIKIKTENLDNPILSLSGGNQQKVLFARALASNAPIVVMDDPMRGVDVGTKKEVYEMIQTEAASGRTFLWYSTETDEVLECDRVFVFRDGGISAELEEEDITEENILRASFEMAETAQ